MSKLIRSIVLAAAALLTQAPASASQILVDFEHLPGPDGVLGTSDDSPMNGGTIELLDNQFAAIGLVFTQGSLYQGTFFNGDPLNHFISSTNPIATLSQPVTGISIESNSFWDATLSAYDVNGNLIESSHLANPNAGSTFLSGVLSVTSTEPIYGFSVLPDNPNYILNLDNLVLTSDLVNAVPEPSQTALFSLGLALMGSLAAARSRRGG